MTTITKGEAVELILEKEMECIKQEMDENPLGISGRLVNLLRWGDTGYNRMTVQELNAELMMWWNGLSELYQIEPENKKHDRETTTK